MDNARTVRNTARRLVLELALVVTLAGLPVTFPLRTSSAHAWSFLAGHPSLLAHAVIGGLVAIESGLVLRAIRGDRSTRSALLTAALGCVSTVTAVAAGIAYVSAGQHDAPLTTMTAGWLVAMLSYAVLWRQAHRALGASAGSQQDEAQPGPTDRPAAHSTGD